MKVKQDHTTGFQRVFTTEGSLGTDLVAGDKFMRFTDCDGDLVVIDMRIIRLALFVLEDATKKTTIKELLDDKSLWNMEDVENV